MRTQQLVEPYGAGTLKLACPGDQQHVPTWFLRFADPDCREQVFIGEHAEQQAWAAWNQYAPSYNCYLFQIAPIKAADELTRLTATVETMREALREIGRILPDYDATTVETNIGEIVAAALSQEVGQETHP